MNNQFRAIVYEEYFLYGVDYLPLSGASGTVFTEFQVRIQRDSVFKLRAVNYRATDARILWRTRDDATGEYFQKGSPDMRATCGRPLTGDFSMVGAYNDFLPFILPTPRRIQPSTNITVEASDFSGADNTVRIALHGGKVKDGAPPWAKKYKRVKDITYELDVGTVGANATLPAVLTTDTDSDFLIEGLTASRAGQATIFISEGTRGRDWMDRYIHLDLVFGRSMFPNLLLKKTPRFIERGRNISVSVTDISGAANRVRLYFIGQKLYG